MKWELPKISPLDSAAQQAVAARQKTLTKPPGSLGRLEELTVHLAGITGRLPLTVSRKAVIVMAADHGVSVEGVSAFPAEVTAQMVLNFLRGGAAVNVLARQTQAHVIIVDMGVAADLPAHPQLITRKIARGTRNIAREPAMTRAQAEGAIAAGLELACSEIDKGLDLIATGDMGIGNTTASAAIVAAITGRSAPQVTGRGTGVDEAGWTRKVAAVEQALALHRPDPNNAMDVLVKVGGFEIAGLAGVMLGAAARRVPVVIDGFISGAAALIAAGLKPEVTPYLIASHRSQEIGHQLALNHLGKQPLLELGLRLGEGTGALLAFPIIEAAVRTLNEMATFEDAGVSNKEA